MVNTKELVMRKTCPGCGCETYYDDWYRRDFECGTSIDQFNSIRSEGNKCLRIQLSRK